MKSNAIIATVAGAAMLFSCTKENNSIHPSAAVSDNMSQAAMALSSLRYVRLS